MISTIKYSQANGKKLIDQLLSRSKLEQPDVQSKVNEIIADVKENKDKALFKYTKLFDGFDANESNIRLTKKEIEEAYSLVDDELIRILKRAADRIKAFHEKQRINSWLEPYKNGEMLGQLVRAVEKAGVYVPGGKAAYPSSVMMNIIPAKVAGVEKIIMTTPPSKTGNVYPTTIVAADIAGADIIYKAGGAQAIAALAFGTQSIEKVDKIVGPGNIFVALAKRSVYGYVNIDSVAGPSEILVLADESADPVYVAADMLSQAEHDELASAILITDSEELAENVKAEIQKQTAVLERKAIIEKSLSDYGAIILTDNFDDAIFLCNKIAPEHMEICTKEPFCLLPKIQNAGAVFLGHYTPEPLGDYMAGPNHVLPTGATARFFSPLGVDDFIKKSSIISFSQQAFKELGDDVIKFAQAEGLTAHANPVRVRMKKL